MWSSEPCWKVHVAIINFSFFKSNYIKIGLYFLRTVLVVLVISQGGNLIYNSSSQDIQIDFIY